MRSAQGHDVVALRQPRLPGVEGAPASKLPEFGQRNKELAAGGLIVGGVIQQSGDPAEFMLARESRQGKHRAAASNVTGTPAHQRDHNTESAGE
ncbi:MAG: hypothetical protein JO281_11295 [Pseudonocardiales bacterium]|nr:hypothetical protein [Pseudonocardiales bacterium]